MSIHVIHVIQVICVIYLIRSIRVIRQPQVVSALELRIESATSVSVGP
jgi:hypothetical protein